ncbi:MAG TPA: FAD-dependent oxidoreductase, partial [Clostridiales bacterium]|nr:FAD-dependent oxidoreductase [Clostridiales bacterium]
PIFPKLPGIHGENVYTAEQILRQEAEFENQDIAVIGSGMTGLETAEYLVKKGNRITLVEMAEELAPGTWIQHVMDVVPKLEEKHTRFITSYKLVEIADDAVYLESTKIPGRRKKIPCRAAVLALGVKPAPLDEGLKNVCAKVYSIGDEQATGRIADATHSAYQAAMKLV